MKKRSNLRYFALFLLLSGIFLITYGILYVRSDIQKEEIDNANNIDNTRTVERCSSLVMANSFL